MNRYKKFIKKGVSEQISKIPFHNYAPMKRLSMLSKKRFPSSNTHVAVHFVNGNHKKMSEYSMLHKHSADEINLIVSENSKLKYEIQLGDETYKVTSPSTVFIPKGVKPQGEIHIRKGNFCLHNFVRKIQVIKIRLLVEYFPKSEFISRIIFS